MPSKYSVYVRVGTSKPPVLILFGDNYKSSTGGAAVAKKALSQLRKHEPCSRKKQFYIRRKSSDIMKVYRASAKKIKPRSINVAGKKITYNMVTKATYLRSIDTYRIVSHT